ncbi:3-hydroxyisobutyrate dehydrogenase [Alteromonas sp. C1M14]|uniref:3-hydroxyisobutyrate dehydrogenase n=1 Tax=Alteromonas sp. C1M14 TaxID=2841567 RepID=UPI001C09C679|nr:3-hydroxyisobutyrate dehydrogenase [Alteromonas sp. C1M14]MBU2979630.1 3-hydroxyisobutyrate dehydrogenase [Alteromonas sp. C1M14]
MNKLAFIGLGNMGSGMAKNLVEREFPVVAYDLNETALDNAKSFGCQIASSAQQAVKDAEIVITMLPAGKHVKALYEGDILNNVSPHTLLIDCSTIDVATAKYVATLAKEKQLAMLDAPVSGGTSAASAGTLTFMVGGDTEAFNQAKDVLNAMGKNIIHAGEHGAGQGAKICNNMLLGASMIATCESFQLAQKLGLDPQVFYDIASNASGQTWSMTRYCPVQGVGPDSPADHEFNGGFASALMLKDLNLAMKGARSVSADVPMGERAAALFAEHCDNGNSALDFSSIINKFT